LAVYDNPNTLLMCVYKRDKALCHRGTKDTPSLDRCVPTCANIARTDQHAAGLRRRATGHRPHPARDAKELSQLQTDIGHLVRAVNQLTVENRQLRGALSQPSSPVRALPTQPRPNRIP
jgi:hypothetical protein